MSENITFRYLTPIFNQSEFTNFQHTGVYKDAIFSISMKGYGFDPNPATLPQDDLDELFKYGNENTIRNLRGFHESNKFFPPSTNVILVADIVQPLANDRKIASNTLESEWIFDSIISALRIHMSAGLTYDNTYLFRSPPSHLSSLDDLPDAIRELSKQSLGCIVFSSRTTPTYFPHLKGLSGLRADQEACWATFQRLLEKVWDYSNTFDTILSIALEYHRTSFALARVEQAFLILMVAFEALFKKGSEKNTDNAAERIAKLLAPTKMECAKTKKAFVSGDQTKDFCKIRNDIAHGDPSLDYELVLESYPILYRYITDGIISLINLPANSIGSNYYDDLTTYTNTRYSGLPQE